MPVAPATWLAEQPFTLVLGAGFFGFFAHAGVLAALEEAGLCPHRVVGVSAGALAGGLWASGLAASRLEAELRVLRREDFWDPGLPLGGLLQGRKFADRLRALLGPVQRVEDTAVPFAAVAHDLWRHAPVVLDRGPLAVAIQASCTVPFMFRPVHHDGRWLVDGGVSDRAGTRALRAGERCLVHHLPSRSPWRHLRRMGAGPPSGREVLALSIPGLPRVSPGALVQGPPALDQARTYVRAWLKGSLK